MAALRSVTVMALAFLGARSVLSASADDRPPNVVIIFADDLGYGDLGCYGHPTIHTPNLDRMAAEGMKWTSFYSAAAVCTPSRAALLTGRLPLRSGMAGETRGVIFPDHQGGIPHEELTLAEALKSKGYATACIGKWHLGHPMEFRPLRHGFDYWFGPETSNDGSIRFELPLWRNDEIVEEHPFDQSTLTRRYTEECLAFIQRNKDRPFFLYLPHTFPHTPLHVAAPFRGRSQRGLYGDVVEELDWSVGQILDTLRSEGLTRNTLVVFTSDNGPWLIRKQEGGSAGLLRAGKGSSFEGGFRVPGIFWWPGKIKSGQTIAETGCTMDLYTTSLLLAGAELPTESWMDSTCGPSCSVPDAVPVQRCSSTFDRISMPSVRARGRPTSRRERRTPNRNRSHTTRLCYSIWSMTPRKSTTSQKQIRKSSSGCAKSKPDTRTVCARENRSTDETNLTPLWPASRWMP